MTERKVSWESYHLPSEFEYKRGSQKEELLDGLDEDDEDDALLAEELRNAPRLMETPMGIVEISDSLNPLANFDFWMLHTNFDISSYEFIATNFEPGVEALSVQSRYRMLIAIGKMFDGQAVKASIADKLINIDKYDPQEYRKNRRILSNMN